MKFLNSIMLVLESVSKSMPDVYFFVLVKNVNAFTCFLCILQISGLLFWAPLISDFFVLIYGLKFYMSALP